MPIRCYCFRLLQGAEYDGRSSRELRIGYLSTVYHTSFILKGTNWLEDKMDVKANWKLFGGGPGIVEAFDKKEVDIGYIGLPPVMIGVDRGIALKCVGGGHVEGTVFIAKNVYNSLDYLNHDLGSVFHQFVGKTIGAPSKGSIHDVIIRNYIKEAGLENNITIKNFEWADLIPEAIMEGDIAGAVGTPPLAVLCARTFKSKIIIPPNKLWPYNPSYGIIVSEKIIQEFPIFVKRFLKLHEKACNFIRKQPEKAAEIVSNVIGLIDKDFILEVYRISPNYCASLPDAFIKSTLAFVPVLQKLKYVTKNLTQRDIFDLRFIEKIHNEPPHY